MNRKSCKQWNTHRKKLPQGCMKNLVCQFGCEHYHRKGCNMKNSRHWEEIDGRTRKEKAKAEREHKAFLKAISTPQKVVDHRRKTTILSKNVSTVSCPACGNSISEDIIRLRDGLYQCRKPKCQEIFVKDGVLDSFDFDGIEDNL